jgi:hypothetical protein
MRKSEGEMRKEYDFSKGVRGKHTGQRLLVVGDQRARKTSSGKLAGEIQKAIELDIKSREGFNDWWSTLDNEQQEKIRAAWLKRIDDLLNKTGREPTDSRP